MNNHSFYLFFFFNDTATTEIYTLSLPDALPISGEPPAVVSEPHPFPLSISSRRSRLMRMPSASSTTSGWVSRSSARSEEHTSELQSRQYLVCRLLLEKKKKTNRIFYICSLFKPI